MQRIVVGGENEASLMIESWQPRLEILRDIRLRTLCSHPMRKLGRASGNGYMALPSSEIGEMD